MFGSSVPITIGSRPQDVDRRVRPAKQTDAEAIAHIQHAALSSVIEYSQPSGEFSAEMVPPVEVVHKYWQTTLSQSAPPGCATVVAVDGHQVVGFALALVGQTIPEIPGKRQKIEPGTEIAELEIHVDFRRAGHASRLIQAIADTIKAPNLRIWISDFDDARQRLVQGAGFAPSGMRRQIHIGNHTVTQHQWWAAVN